MRRVFTLCLVMLMATLVLLTAQTSGLGKRIALVIGNATYAVSPLGEQPINDARDVEAALRRLGFSVLRKENLTKRSMEETMDGFYASAIRADVAVFYYSGHGAQSLGVTGNENYLLPVDFKASGGTATEVDVKNDGYSIQRIADSLSLSSVEASVFIIDACRTFPVIRGGKSTKDGLVAQRAVEGSVFLFATQEGQVAQSGSGRNSIYTAELLRYLEEPGISVMDMASMVADAVYDATMKKQLPSAQTNLVGILCLNPVAAAPTAPSSALTPTPGPTPVPATPAPAITMTLTYGSVIVTAASAGTLFIDGALVGELPSGEVRLDNIQTGSRNLELRYATGDKETRTVTVKSAAPVIASFTWKRPDPVVVKPPPAPPIVAATPAKPAAPSAPAAPLIEGRFIRLPGGTFTMGSSSTEYDRGSSERPQHQVTVSPFSIGACEVTFDEYDAFCSATGRKKPSDQGWGRGNRPVINVNWYDAVEYCNWRSVYEGKKPAYTIAGPSVTWDRTANGYRLPTEAEWEYACRAGTITAFAFGGGLATTQANFNGNYSFFLAGTGAYLEKTQPVGSYVPNKWNIYDMHGNVWEWCWDWYGQYSAMAQTNPTGAREMNDCVIRGGSWFYGGGSLRSAARDCKNPYFRNPELGFRIVFP